MFRRSFLSCLLLIAASGLAAPAARAARTILVFGDSLSAGYGIRQEDSWPALLDKRLRQVGFDYSVVNASISGETTSGGRARLENALLKHSPEIVIIALGSNDGLRGLPINTLRDNLLAMTDAVHQRKSRVLIVGQRLPPNYGPYATQFASLFADVAKNRKTAFVDFLLDGVALTPELFQADNLHPTATAQPRLLDNVWRVLEPMLKR